MLLSKKLEEKITLIVESLGYFVYDIEYGSARIAIYIDKEGGVSIADCENVSRNISVLLDVEDPFSSPYTLEVSSPGINRKLKRREHFEKAVGKRCVVKTHNSIDNSKVFRGKLLNIDSNSIGIETDKGSVEIDFENIKTAKIDEEVGGKRKI